MSQQITGVHIFEKRGPIDWEDELIAIQALSALSWKKFHGRIELYCNESHLESLKKWGVDKLYDKIDTELFANAPEEINRFHYWTFGKIFIPSMLEPPFVLVDTDLWITSELEFDFTKSLIAHHEEKFDKNYKGRFYDDFTHFLPEKYIGYFDDTINPLNVALLFVNDKDLVNEWFKISTEVLKSNRKTKLSNTQQIVFLEQRMLSMLAKKLDKNYSTFITQVYDSDNPDIMDDNLWEPPTSKWNEEEKIKFYSIKHVWGLKKMFNDQFIFSEVFDKVSKDINNYDLGSLGLSDIKKFVNEKSGFFESRKFENSEKISIIYFIPNIITDSETNILIKRIEYLYEFSKNIEIFVCKLESQTRKNNTRLENRIIKIIGTQNFLTSNTTDILNEIQSDIVHFEVSKYSNEFNSLMQKEFNEKKYKVVKSSDGINLISNFGTEVKIEYPKINNIIKLIENSLEHKLDTNTLPIHIKYQQRILLGLDMNKKHILCLGDLKEIPNSLLNYISEIYKVDSSIEFHFLNDLNVNSSFGERILNILTQSTKVWLENVDLYDFIKILDFVISFDKNDNLILFETESYGIPSMKWNNSSVIDNLKFINLQLIKKQVLPLIEEPVEFCETYLSFYGSLKSKQ